MSSKYSEMAALLREAVEDNASVRVRLQSGDAVVGEAVQMVESRPLAEEVEGVYPPHGCVAVDIANENEFADPDPYPYIVTVSVHEGEQGYWDKATALWTTEKKDDGEYDEENADVVGIDRLD
ncbi:MAG: hypothetical protein ABEI77_05300 [Halorientalis sp.]